MLTYADNIILVGITTGVLQEAITNLSKGGKEKELTIRQEESLLCILFYLTLEKLGRDLGI
jgi:hypothetical protein